MNRSILQAWFSKELARLKKVPADEQLQLDEKYIDFIDIAREVHMGYCARKFGNKYIRYQKAGDKAHLIFYGMMAKKFGN